VVIEVLVFTHFVRLPFVQVTILGATHSLTHWIGWGGALFIVFATPALPIVKRKKPNSFPAALTAHTVGNLVAVLLVSIHFAHQVTRPAQFYPDLGTGIVLYATIIILTASGIIIYSNHAKKMGRQLRFLHPAFALTFYTVIVMHIIQGI
jgi:hypothetical protein